MSKIHRKCELERHVIEQLTESRWLVRLSVKS